MKKEFFCCIIFYFFLSSCQPVIHKELHRAEMLMDTASTGSLQILYDLYIEYPDMDDENKALYGLLLAWASDKNALPIEEYGDMIDFSVGYYQGNRPYLALSYFYKARICRYRRDYTGAIQNLLKSRELANPAKDYSLIAKIYFDFAQISIYQDDFTKALEYLAQAKVWFEKSGETHHLAKMSLVEGWIYQTTENFDDAVNASLRALELTTDSVVTGDVMNDIGYTYYLKSDYDSALYYIRKSFSYPYYSTNMALRYAHMGNVFSELNKYDSAVYYLEKALSSDIDIYIERDCYESLISIYLLSDDKQKLAIYLDKKKACEDSILKVEKQPDISILQQLHEAGKDISAAKTRHRLLIGIIVIMLFSGSFVFIVQGRKKRKLADTLEQKHRQLITELHEEKNRSGLYEEELKQKHQSLLDELLDELEKARAASATKRKKASYEQLCEIDREIYRQVLSLDNENEFTGKMNRVLNHLPDKLKNDYPDITYKETVWCCLFILDIPSTDMALLMSYTQNSLYKFKQRLIKKLGLGNSKDLEQILHLKTGF